MKPIYIILILIILAALGVSVYTLRVSKTTETPLSVIKEEIADILIKSRSSGYIWYKSDKVKVFLYAPNETQSVVSNKNKSCEMLTLGASVFEGDYKLILDPSTGEMVYTSWDFDPERNLFAERQITK